MMLRNLRERFAHALDQHPDRFVVPRDRRNRAGNAQQLVHRAVCAARTEYSTFNTTSSGISTNWLMKARFLEVTGTGSGRSLVWRGMNMLVMWGRRHGT
jgi:hypothetical protein